MSSGDSRAFPLPPCEVPWIDTDQMIEVDRAMMFDYGISLVQMMENAGRGLARLARARFLDGDANKRVVVVLAGTGGNGGGAITSARRLASWGARVHVVATSQERMTDVPARQLDIVRKMGVAVGGPEMLAQLTEVDLIIDGVIGYSLAGSPRGAAAAMIEWANRHTTAVLALDAPSGLDTTSGEIREPAIRARATLTLALPKRGLRAAAAKAHVGELFLADISVPPTLYASEALGLTVGPLFSRSDILSLAV